VSVYVVFFDEWKVGEKDVGRTERERERDERSDAIREGRAN
jgi:hypothetical protein